MSEREYTFELHITVDENQIFKMMRVCNEHKFDLDFAVGPVLYDVKDKTELAVANQQLMLTKIIRATFANAIARAEEIAFILRDNEIQIVRTKLEVPARHRDLNLLREYLDEECPVYMSHAGYFEFHFKVLLETLDQEERLKEVTLRHNASYSYNAFGSTKNKILTAQRVRTEKFEDALNERNVYISDLQDAGLCVDTSGSGVHYEYVVYDDNPYLDDGFVPTP